MNRRADNWLLQLAIADLAGLDWGDKARAAAIKIEGKADNRTIGVRILADIKALFDADPEAHCMSSATMVAKLTEDPEGPWAEFAGANPSRRTVSPSCSALTASLPRRWRHPDRRPRKDTTATSLRRLGPTMCLNFEASKRQSPCGTGTSTPF